METYHFKDALTGASVSCEYPSCNTRMAQGDSDVANATSVFFPGCSLINYALPLADAVSKLLQEANQIDGISLLCCGKILSYEPDGETVRAAFEKQLVERLASSNIKRFITACPNCTKALRAAFAQDERTADIQVEPLPVVLARLGYRIDASVVRQMLLSECNDLCGSTDIKLCPHDSCPDRDMGEFADGLRALLPEDMLVEAKHNRKRSLCCGSLVRAKGKYEEADKQALHRAEEAQTVGAAALVTACVSCSFQMTLAQRELPVFHYLEFLFNWRIPWSQLDGYMKLRFLFDESLGTNEEKASSRAFIGLDSAGKV